MQKRNSSSQETPRLRSGRPLNTTPLVEAFIRHRSWIQFAVNSGVSNAAQVAGAEI